ncbi:hypothetical protein EVAR_33161_1 [Eumeta japonica]|uniref:Uncharacterized protein n=1 Tax=Eumeta variegata TaxID=151549 RepID=A0A4C1ZQL4_EUMVA|nr:hypothetical protein EVAR_33161_1 [Eumeta japonica]
MLFPLSRWNAALKFALLAPSHVLDRSGFRAAYDLCPGYDVYLRGRCSWGHRASVLFWRKLKLMVYFVCGQVSNHTFFGLPTTPSITDPSPLVYILRTVRISLSDTRVHYENVS